MVTTAALTLVDLVLVLFIHWGNAFLHHLDNGAMTVPVKVVRREVGSVCGMTRFIVMKEAGRDIADICL